VPEVVQPSPHDHPATGKSHDLPDPGAILLAVAMDMTVLAGRLGVEWAFAALIQGIPDKRATFRAEVEPFSEQICKIGRESGLYLVSMADTAEYPDETHEQLEVFLLCVGELFHGVHVSRKPMIRI